MTPEHRAALRAGRERAAIERRQHAVATVKAFRTWLLTRTGPCPPIPRDRDYRLFREGLR